MSHIGFLWRVYHFSMILCSASLLMSFSFYIFCDLRSRTFSMNHDPCDPLRISWRHWDYRLISIENRCVFARRYRRYLHAMIRFDFDRCSHVEQLNWSRASSRSRSSSHSEAHVMQSLRAKLCSNRQRMSSTLMCAVSSLTINPK